jgi:hypothetical protein
MGISEWLAFASLVLNVIVAITALTVGLGKIRDTVREQLHKEINKMREQTNADIDNMARSFGESVAAIREKIAVVELESYKVFMRRDSFQELTKAIEARMDRYENKLDRFMESSLRHHDDLPR